MGPLQALLIALWSPKLGLFRIIKQFLEEEFHEVRGSKVDFEVDFRGIGVGLRGIPAFMFGVRDLGPHIASDEQARV
jgi:hypothetical protein